MNRMSHVNEIVRALLEADEDEDLVKELSGKTQDELDIQLAQMLPELVKQKELYLNKKFKGKATVHTNPHGQTFCYAKFGNVMSTLAYLDPERGWVPDKWMDLPESHEEEGEYKDVFHKNAPLRRYIPFGTLIHNTLQEEDLIPAFLDAIASVDPVYALELKANYSEEIKNADPEFCWETLMDAVNKYSPPYSYFGPHEGNASDFGVWPSDEKITETAEDKPEELKIVNQGEPITPGSKYIAVRNQDGTYVALLDGETGEEIWQYD